jgi:hypothetical protein
MALSSHFARHPRIASGLFNLRTELRGPHCAAPDREVLQRGFSAALDAAVLLHHFAQCLN